MAPVKTTITTLPLSIAKFLQTTGSSGMCWTKHAVMNSKPRAVHSCIGSAVIAWKGAETANHGPMQNHVIVVITDNGTLFEFHLSNVGKGTLVKSYQGREKAERKPDRNLQEC